MSTVEFHVVIPARFASTRFPGKPLAVLAGRPVIEHVWRQAGASGAASVVVATDDGRIASAARGFGADVQLTDAAHRSGTERAAEVAARRGWADAAIVVNVQGDAPLIPPAAIDQVAALLATTPTAGMATLCTPISTAEDYRSAHVVKVVADQAGRALYFSRAPIPALGHGASGLPECFRHVGLYAYRSAALRTLAGAPPCSLEQAESLEQLRALWLGIEIRVAPARALLGPDVDTPEDLERAAAFLLR